MESEVNNIFIPERTDQELFDGYVKMKKSELAGMILENFKYTSREKQLDMLCSDNISTETLAKLMINLHKMRNIAATSSLDYTISFGSAWQQDPDTPTPELLSSPLCIPYQACPKCHGQGVVPYPPGWPLVHDGTMVQDSMSYTCDVCNGQKIIPMCVIKEKE
jgi:hypothetical protein